MKVLVSAGPTREAIDPVRFLSNRSTGKMGYALAAAAVMAGHEVSLVSGPVSIAAPEGLEEFIQVESAAEMAAAMKARAQEADAIVMCAAVADYRPAETAKSKIKKKDGALSLELVRTEDILLSLGAMKRPGQILAGFAAETDALEANALDKMKRKSLDWIVANEVGLPDRGFEAEANAVTLYAKDGRKIELPLESKSSLAEKILSVILS